MTLCIIPARGGSKRIPRKNIRPFLGKPMIAWSIETALESNLFDHIIVSTDDEEIAAIAREAGAEIPFMRPPELANDFAGTDEVVAHAIKEIIGDDNPHEEVCCLYATAPFVTAHDLRKGLNMLRESGKYYVFTVCPFRAPIQRALRLTTEGVEMFFPEHEHTRSQDLEPAYHDAGQFYWGRAYAWLKKISIFSHASSPLILPAWRVQDIDTEEDWIYAELLMLTLQKRKGG